MSLMFSGARASDYTTCIIESVHLMVKSFFIKLNILEIISRKKDLHVGAVQVNKIFKKNGNPFEGKKHSDKTKEIIRLKRAKQDMSYMQTEAYKKL